MGYRCAVLQCRNSVTKTRASDKNIKYYSFPKNYELRTKWVSVCQRTDKWVPDNLFICSEHFKETDFERDLKAELLNLPPKRILKPDAIPTLNLWSADSDDQQSAIRKVRKPELSRNENKENLRNVTSDSSSRDGFAISFTSAPKLFVSAENGKVPEDMFKHIVEVEGTSEQYTVQVDNISDDLENRAIIKLDDLCRLCGSEGGRMKQIFGTEHDYSETINFHLPELQVNKEDILPLQLCMRCEININCWSQFYKSCNTMNKKFQDILKSFTTQVPSVMNYIGDTTESINTIKANANTDPAYDTYSNGANDVALGEDTDIREIEIVEVTSDITETETLDIFPDEKFEIKDNSADFLHENPEEKEEVGSAKLMEDPSENTSRGEIKEEHENTIFLEENYEGNMSSEENENSEHSEQEEQKTVRSPRLSRVRREAVNGSRRRRRKRIPTLNLRRMCHICGKIFKYPESLRRHLKTVHSDERPFKCHLCTSSFNRNHNLTIHIKVVHQHQRVYVKKHVPRLCDYCGKVLLSARSLEEHISSIHTKKALYECDKCNSTFYRKLTFDKHRSSDECDSNNPKKCNAPKTEEVFLKYCEFCGLEFKKEHFYTKHKLKHMSNFVCSICSVNFEDSTLLKEHVDTEHPEVKPFECEVCGKKFRNKPLLNCHLIIHTGEKRYQCQYCSLKFLKKKYLSTHILTHTGERPFVCTICGKGFKQSGDMRKHKATHIRKQI